MDIFFFFLPRKFCLLLYVLVMSGKEGSERIYGVNRVRSAAELMQSRSGASPRTRGVRNVSPTPHVQPPPTPACEHCSKKYETSCKVVDAYYSLLSSVKSQYLQDTLRHVDENDVWIRALKMLGVPENDYLSRIVSISELTASET